MPSAKLQRHIALLRGVNVGGHGKLPMAALREICVGLGCSNVSTYIQSGNVILDSPLSASQLVEGLMSAIDTAVGFAPKVVIRAPDALARAVEENPYRDTEERFLHVGFMSATPTASAVKQLAGIDCSPEGFTISGAEIFLNYVEGVGTSKRLAKVPFERKLGVDITARNLRTVKKLLEMST